MKRIITAALAIPLALLITIYAPPWLFALVVSTFSMLMFDEFLRLSTAAGRPTPGRWALWLGAIVAESFYGGPTRIVTALTGSSMILLMVCVFDRDVSSTFSRATTGLSGLLYCSMLFGFMILLSRDAILTLFAIIWAGDTGAYYGGRLLGRHSLLRRVSPKKTVEGAIVGLIASVLAGTAVGVWRLGLPWMNMALMSLIAAGAGQIGDLVESALKRSAGVKDSSSILPGHGGILDRLDSLLFAAPVFFWLLNA
jgi:phosphatidate cytidylyltransferase